MPPDVIIISLFVIALVAAGSFFYWQNYRLRRKAEAQYKAQQVALAKREREMNRRMYELEILKELGDRAGYSLNVQNIIDIITGSLHQFLSYSAVSYMLLGPKVIFKVHLEKSVSRKFIDDIRTRMLNALGALLDKELNIEQVEEVLSGVVLGDDANGTVQSFFNIPLEIGTKLVGILTIADTAPGLYKDEEMTLLYKITRQASQAVTRLEEVVKAEQGKLNAMVESMAEGVVMVDKEYRVAVVNPAAKRVIGLMDRAEVTIFDFIDNLEGTFDIRGKLEEAITLSKASIIEEVLIRDHFYQIFVAPVKAGAGMLQGEVLGGTVIFHDITREKEIERLREDFTNMMVHELRSPLDGIKKIAEILRDKETWSDAKNVEDFLGMIYENSSRMLELVGDLLDVAKLESGKFDMHPQLANMQELIVERQKFFASLASGNQQQLEVIFDPNLPPQLSFDSQRISQVLNNLISNALKFTPKGGRIVLRAFVHSPPQNLFDEAQRLGEGWPQSPHNSELGTLPPSVVIAVSDNGVGIPPEQIGQLFNKFKQFRAAAVSGEKRGTGLGLAIVKGIVEAHHGKIGVISEENSGSTFFFTLPLALEKEGK